MTDEKVLEAAAWAGRQQAFALIASKCSAAQAQCLRQIRESRAHDQLGLTWEQFCVDQAGISRSHADYLIRQLDEFGEKYFKLSELARVSPTMYRQISGRVHDDAIEIDGKSIPLTSENAPAIRRAILQTRADFRRIDRETRRHRGGAIEYQVRAEALFREISARASAPLDDDELAALRTLCAFSLKRWKHLGEALDAATPIGQPGDSLNGE